MLAYQAAESQQGEVLPLWPEPGPAPPSEPTEDSDPGQTDQDEKERSPFGGETPERKYKRWRDGPRPRGGAGSAPVRGRRPQGYYTARGLSRMWRAPLPWWVRLPLALLRFGWRFVSGGELRGQTLTDAMWFQRGLRCYTHADKPPHPWFFLPRSLRALIRWAGTAVVLAVAWAWLSWPTTTPWVLWAATVVGGGWLGWVSACSLVLWPHRIKVVNPTARRLAPLLGLPPNTPARRFLHIPPDFTEPGAAITLILPGDFTGEQAQKDKIKAALCEVLPLVGSVTELAGSAEPGWEAAS